MLSIGKLAPGQQDYYLDTVAAGLEEYYTGAKEAPGQWLGRSAARLGLDGVVDGEDLGDLLAGLDPSTNERLTRAQGAPKIPGFDATFNAPKSVSLLFALGDAEVSNEVRNAHDAAVTSALEVLEDEAARVRRGKGGLTQLPAEGFVAAAFRHRTSRAGDPHLHTHVLVANLVYSPVDGRWSALDARPLYGWAKTVGYLYETHLRYELTRRLGVAWQEVTNGIADLAGIPETAIADHLLDRERAYSALSRGCQRNDVYLADADDHRDGDRHLPEITPDEAAEFGRMLRGMNVKSMAIDLRTVDLGLEPVLDRQVEHGVSIEP